MELYEFSPASLPSGTNGASQSGGVAGARKLQTPLSFPTGEIDMSPYTSAALLRGRRGGGSAASPSPSANGGSGHAAAPPRQRGRGGAAVEGSRSDGEDSDAADPTGASSRFTLLAVVCHKGDISGGHYVCYVKVRD